MKQFKKEFLTQHLLVLCAMSIIGALVRNEAMQYGVDTFSCNLTFVISTTILMVVYRCNMWMLLIVKLLSFKRYNYPFYKCRENEQQM